MILCLQYSLHLTRNTRNLHSFSSLKWLGQPIINLNDKLVAKRMDDTSKEKYRNFLNKNINCISNQIYLNVNKSFTILCWGNCDVFTIKFIEFLNIG